MVWSVAFNSFADFSSADKERLGAIVREISNDWQTVRAAAVNRNLTNAEKSQAVDLFFEKLGAKYQQEGQKLVDLLLERLRESDSQNASRPSSKDQEEGLSKAINESLEGLVEESAKDDDAENGGISSAEKFVQKMRENGMIPRGEVAIRLLRDIVRLEEDKIFALLSENGDRVRQINISSELSKDIYFLFKQGRALTRLVIAAVGTVKKVGDVVEIANNQKADTLSGLRDAGIGKPFHELIPTIIESADDLGIYYAKLLQSFTSLMFHVDRESYNKVDYFQGQLPLKMPFQQVKETIEADLKMPLEKAYLTFEREPFANGSIAQVHWATVPGKKGPKTVTVKVLKDFVPEELKWNMRTNAVLFDYLEGIADAGSSWLVRFFTTQARELGRTYEGELDFVAEAKRQILFRRILAPITEIKIPQVDRLRSGHRVLTTEGVLQAKRIHNAFEEPKAPEAATSSEEATPVKPAAKTTPSAEAAESTQKLFLASASKEPIEESTSNSEEVDDLNVIAPELEKQKGVSETESSIGKLFLTLTEKYGYSFGPQYFQVIRSVLPFGSVIVHLSRLEKSLRAQGRNADDHELVSIQRSLQGLTRSFLFQIFYAKELHSDLNWGNILVNPQSTYMIDWGQTVSTRGLVFRPAVLVLGFIKGDAELVVKKLGQLGKFRDFKKDRKEIVELVQRVMDEQGIEKETWWGMVRSVTSSSDSKESRRAKRIEAEKSEEKPIERKEEASRDEVKTPEPSADQVSQPASGPALATPKTKAAASSQADLTKAIGKIAGPVAKALLAYPYHRTRVRLIRAYTYCESSLARR